LRHGEHRLAQTRRQPGMITGIERARDDRIHRGGVVGGHPGEDFGRHPEAGAGGHEHDPREILRPG